MGAGKPTEDANRVDRIVGWTQKGADGINVQDAPHIIGESEFQHLENVRWQGKYLRPRGGQALFTPVNPTGDDAFFLWGAYGGVMQHGGIGGVANLDDPALATPGAPGDDGLGIVWTISVTHA